MQVFFITGSDNKFREAKAIIPQLMRLSIDLPEIQSLDSREIIKAKLETAFQHNDGPFVVEDTSLTFNCLGQLPGPLIKWFIESLGLEKLYGLAEKHNNFKAIARTLIGYAENRDKITFFEGFTAGTIVKPRGFSGFGFDPIFVPEGYSKTMAELNPDEKNEISSRRRAFEQLAALIQ